jgi:TatD DNase family protein
MNLPGKGDYIDIHTHGAEPATGIFSIETLSAHEERLPEDLPGMLFTYGIHPWYLDEKNHNQQLTNVIKVAANPLVVAIGEAGFDKLKGPSADLQKKTFEEQVYIAEERKKPVVIHCVKAWDELIKVYKMLKPKMPWLVHGFRGKKDLALQLIAKGIYLSFWFDFIIRPESSQLLRALPKEKIFLETDGAEIDIKEIYNKVAVDLEMSIDELKIQVLDNFNRFYGI